ncbi:MAG: M14 family metallopeptidase [Novosphingobium sp.]|uniref:M14 family metallopeptidase n=1 Tax=Novosphingobium sp. TaxID=1874826 RepID=UPI00301A4DC3
MTGQSCFAADYAQARDMFCAAARAADAAIESIPHPDRGPSGGVLSCDTAWLGPKTAPHVLVTISGTHGVEGFAGSGAQVDALRRIAGSSLPADVAVLMVHAINPHGFAWARRVTEDNIDLNRNWIDFTAPLPLNKGHDALAPALYPTEWNDAAQASLLAAITDYAAQHGAAAMQAAISGGQYCHPRGIFYGGAKPGWSRRTQTALLTGMLGHAEQVVIIDFHTGLGPRGIGEQIVTVPRSSPQFARASAFFGAAITSTHDGSSSSAVLVGDGLSAAPALLPHAKVTAMALEFGTVPEDQVVAALAADAWLHAHGDPLSPQGRAISANVRRAFYDDSTDWQGMVVCQALLACRQAIAALHRKA